MPDSNPAEKKASPTIAKMAPKSMIAFFLMDSSKEGKQPAVKSIGANQENLTF